MQFSSLMKTHFLPFLLIFLFVSGSEADENRKATVLLNQINNARELLASGALRKLKQTIGAIPGLNFPVLGPAANMYRLKWSKSLEEEAAKQQVKGLYGNIKKDGYSGFYWMHSIHRTVKEALKPISKHIPFDRLTDVLEGVASGLEMVETLLLLIWVGVTYPKTLPIPANAELGPTEALFAHRYEIGCSFTTHAVCVLRDGVANGTLFQEGVACTACPTHCEFYEHIDGTIDEGELCAAPKGELGASGATVGCQTAATIMTLMILLFTR